MTAMRRAVVVGATSGIGREVARQLAGEGWLVGVAGRRKERLEQLVQTTQGIEAYECLDVTSEDASDALQRLIDKLGGMDLYFHSSGIGWQNVGLDVTRELATVATNGAGFVRMLTFAFRYFEEERVSGHIACITSIAGTKGLGAAPAYSATKRFQSHYVQCLAQLARIRGLHIKFTDLRPGFVATDLIAGSRFPLQMRADDVARCMVRAVKHGRRRMVIDWRYALLVALWRLIPDGLWERMKVHA